MHAISVYRLQFNFNHDLKVEWSSQLRSTLTLNVSFNIEKIVKLRARALLSQVQVERINTSEQLATPFTLIEASYSFVFVRARALYLDPALEEIIYHRII